MNDSANSVEGDGTQSVAANGASPWIATAERLPDDEQKVLGWYIRPGIDEDFYTVFLKENRWHDADHRPFDRVEAPDFWCIPAAPNA